MRIQQGYGESTVRSTSKIVFRLPNIHPIAVKDESKQAFIPDYEWESFLLDGSWPQLDALYH